MRVVKIIVYTMMAFVAIGSSLPPNTPTRALREQKVKQQTLEQVIGFHRFVSDSLLPAAMAATDGAVLQRRFLNARMQYKTFEWAAEYFIAPLARRINGPPAQEVENADLMDPSMVYAVDPSGLQIIEEYVFPAYDSANKAALIEEVRRLEENAGYLQSYFTDHALSDWRILDAAKLEIFRMVALGITGYDNPLSLHSMEECAASLKSLRHVLAQYAGDGEQGLIGTVESAIGYLEGHPDFDGFDRAAFITTYANKISTGIAELEAGHAEGKKHYNRLLNQDARTMFDVDAFNVNAFAPGSAYHLTAAKARLGEALFYDRHLSGDSSRSCATCHNPHLGFTDGMATNTYIYDSSKHLHRNTPTLLHAALQSNYFYDMRTLTLEDQVLDVIHNKDEMDGDFDDITAYLRGDPHYRTLFDSAFPSRTTGEQVRPFQVANALASYVRSLAKPNSRFDQYMRGDDGALTDEEVDGFNLFMGKAKCATCHFVPLFNGITPPKYTESEAEVISVPKSLTDSIVDPDNGWYDVIGTDSYRHAFKTPTVRNVDRTAPYMHNGIYETLEDVMEFYNNAGPVGLGIELENTTLSGDSLHLTDKEIDHIVKFMESLGEKLHGLHIR